MLLHILESNYKSEETLGDLVGFPESNCFFFAKTLKRHSFESKLVSQLSGFTDIALAESLVLHKFPK